MYMFKDQSGCAGVRTCTPTRADVALFRQIALLRFGFIVSSVSVKADFSACIVTYILNVFPELILLSRRVSHILQ